jgi:YbgC/YbaW family acyl-CoA thioester hydrolase
MSEPLPEVRFHIYPTDCDMLGHVNHAEMIRYFERARWALFADRMEPQGLARQAVYPVIRHVDIGYRAPVLPNEDLVVRSGILKVGTTSFTVRQQARNPATGAVAAEADLVVVAVDQSGRPVPVPQNWMQDMPTWPTAP